MKSFLRSMVWRGGENDRENGTADETRSPAPEEQGNDQITMASSEGLGNRPDSEVNTPEATVSQRRSSTLRLFGNSKKLLSHVTARQSPNTEDLKKPKTLPVEDAVRELEENCKSPTRPPSVSKSFVKKIVAALERKYRDNEPDDSFENRYDVGPIHAYEKSGTIRKSRTKDRKQVQEEAIVPDEVKTVDEKTKVKPQGTTPKIIGAFLKKPVKVQDTSIYWIPLTGKKLPRKKSFKKLLAKLTGKEDEESSTTKGKHVVFASQENLVQEIQDSGYDGRSASSRASSVTSFYDALMYQESNYIDEAYTDSNFSTFVTSSPLKKSKTSSELKNLTGSIPDTELAFEDVEIREDPGYVSNYSVLDEYIPKHQFVSTRAKQNSYQPRKLPKHPFVRSEPLLHEQYDDEHSPREEIKTPRKFCKVEPIYNVSNTRPTSSILDECLSMERRDVPIQAVAPVTRCDSPVLSDFDDDEELHYATVRAWNTSTYISFTELCTDFSVPILSRRSMRSSSANSTVDEPVFVTHV